MNKLLIDRKKLPIKYIFNVYQQLKDFPTPEDILFEIVGHFEEYGVTEELNVKQIQKILSFKLSTKEIEECINTLTSKGYVTTSKENTKFIHYTIVTHPWCF